MKKNNKKGFTLAELLIVVAIIAVLTAIAIPVFSGSLVKSKEAADMANVRACYADQVTRMLGGEISKYASKYDTHFGSLYFSSKLKHFSMVGGKFTVEYSGSKAGSLKLEADALE